MPDRTTSATPDTVLERTVDATPAEVWRLWTDPDQFRSWYGPAGASIPTARFDLRPGGERVVAMVVSTPGGERAMWFRGEHVEVDAPRLLVYTEAMSDEDGGPLSPLTTVRVELEDLGEAGALVRVTHHGVPADSPGAAGWNMALDKLVAALA